MNKSTSVSFSLFTGCDSEAQKANWAHKIKNISGCKRLNPLKLFINPVWRASLMRRVSHGFQLCCWTCYVFNLWPVSKRAFLLLEPLKGQSPCMNQRGFAVSLVTFSRTSTQLHTRLVGKIWICSAGNWCFFFTLLFTSIFPEAPRWVFYLYMRLLFLLSNDTSPSEFQSQQGRFSVI